MARVNASAYEDLGTGNVILNPVGVQAVGSAADSVTVAVVTFDGGDSTAVHDTTLDGGVS